MRHFLGLSRCAHLGITLASSLVVAALFAAPAAEARITKIVANQTASQYRSNQLRTNVMSGTRTMVPSVGPAPQVSRGSRRGR